MTNMTNVQPECEKFETILSGAAEVQTLKGGCCYYVGKLLFTCHELNIHVSMVKIQLFRICNFCREYSHRFR